MITSHHTINRKNQKKHFNEKNLMQESIKMKQEISPYKAQRIIFDKKYNKSLIFTPEKTQRNYHK